MLIQILLSAILSVSSPIVSDSRPIFHPTEAGARLIYVQSKPAFLTDDQIRMLLTGTEVTHQPPGGPGTAHLTFKSSGKVKIRNFKGKTRTGDWEITGPQVVCLSGIGGLGDKNFCVKLTFDGKNIHHHVAATGEAMGVPPWVIEKPGPDVGNVPTR